MEYEYLGFIWASLRWIVILPADGGTPQIRICHRDDDEHCHYINHKRRRDVRFKDICWVTFKTRERRISEAKKTGSMDYPNMVY